MNYYQYEQCGKDEGDFIAVKTNWYSDHLTGPANNKIIGWFNTRSIETAKKLMAKLCELDSQMARWHRNGEVVLVSMKQTALQPLENRLEQEVVEQAKKPLTLNGISDGDEIVVTETV